MSRASKAGLIRGISTACGFMRPVLPSRRPFPSFTWPSPVNKRDDLSAYALGIGDRPVCHPCPLASDGLGPVSVVWCFQVVKTAQSRGRTERTLVTALSQLRWRDKGREVWFSLGENHEKACHSPDFLRQSTGREQLCATCFTESRM